MNILIPSCARRIDFVGFFKNALRDLGIDGKVVVADPDYNAPSLQAGDNSYVIPHQTDEKYLDKIFDICDKENIDCIVPLNDWEVPKLASAKSEFLNKDIKVLVAEEDVVEKVRDKGKYRELLEPFEVKAPISYMNVEDAKKGLQSGEVDYPLIIKPRNGSASMGVDFANNLDEVQHAYDSAVKEILDSPLDDATSKEAHENVIIQEVIEGDKFSVDIFNDLDGNFVTSLVRKQLDMRGGDIDRCITENPPELMAVAEKIGSNLNHVGYMNADVYYNGKDYYVIDINPRFGGGYAFSHRAGANIPAAIIAMVKGDEVKKEWLIQKAGLELARHDTVVNINKEKPDVMKE
ncbi:carbamoyl-phosphate synthase large subunit [Gracilibacillus ureilyticus]|uniref:Carbamoyl-phosphate synthase large subunit n=1 Tax=Gracilibacillus ureilyticus TaxID=531814 RepID=A0A1H9NA90_9BACI|nr:ATP-grasp domain-containing protein [Gracilibacillus ureilyticus]SER32886.1 carbamoyl-phosphate synthase large subunit [Gracilibacillus ureilyticus]